MANTYEIPTLQASGGSFASLKTYGLAGQLEALITQNAIAPVAPTVAPPTSATAGGAAGGAIAPGTYYVEVTETNGIGETTASPESTIMTVSRQANPTVAATAAATGGGATGGLLAAGTYYVYYTWVDTVSGESTVGTSASVQLTVSATNIPRVTIPALPSYAASANIYLTPVGGALGTEQLYKTGVTGLTTDLTILHPLGAVPPAANTTSTSIPRITFTTLKTGNIARNVYVTAANGLTGTEVLWVLGITASTYDLATAAPVSVVVPPTTLTTALSTRATNLARSAKNNNLDHEFRRASIEVSNYLSGRPVSSAEVIQQLIDHSVAFLLIAKTLTEVGKLIYDNQGTLTTAKDSAGNDQAVRTFS